MQASYKIAMGNGHSFQLGDCNRGICSNTALCLVWIDSQGSRARCSAQFALACRLGVWDSGRCIETHTLQPSTERVAHYLIFVDEVFAQPSMALGRWLQMLRETLLVDVDVDVDGLLFGLGLIPSSHSATISFRQWRSS